MTPREFFPGFLRWLISGIRRKRIRVVLLFAIPFFLGVSCFFSPNPPKPVRLEMSEAAPAISNVLTDVNRQTDSLRCGHLASPDIRGVLFWECGHGTRGGSPPTHFFSGLPSARFFSLSSGFVFPRTIRQKRPEDAETARPSPPPRHFHA